VQLLATKDPHVFFSTKAFMKIWQIFCCLLCTRPSIIKIIPGS
jgi:hypothetical protein